MPATPAWPPRSAPRLFVAGPLGEGGQIALEGAQAHYLSRVMRTAPGDTVILCDDLTGEWAGIVSEAGKRAVVLDVRQISKTSRRSPRRWPARRSARRRGRRYHPDHRAGSGW